MTTAELLRVPLPCDHRAPRQARASVRRLDAVGPVREDAVLLVSELVSSAVLEPETRPAEQEAEPPETIELIASEVADGVELAVATRGRGVRPFPRAISAAIVRALARSWGLERRGDRTELWAQLAV